jgi:uncharacterized Fe-S cluster-containing radical SAM superfamily enzyme
MDTRTVPAAKVDVSAQIEEIKRFMPETYKTIKAKAEAIGNEAFVLVRSGLRGEANMFYAFEGGRVVGTPFSLVDVARDIAQIMVTFGCTHVCIWAESTVKVEGVAYGAH